MNNGKLSVIVAYLFNLVKTRIIAQNEKGSVRAVKLILLVFFSSHLKTKKKTIDRKKRKWKAKRQSLFRFIAVKGLLHSSETNVRCQKYRIEDQ